MEYNGDLFWIEPKEMGNRKDSSKELSTEIVKQHFSSDEGVRKFLFEESAFWSTNFESTLLWNANF